MPVGGGSRIGAVRACSIKGDLAHGDAVEGLGYDGRPMYGSWSPPQQRPNRWKFTTRNLSFPTRRSYDEVPIPAIRIRIRILIVSQSSPRYSDDSGEGRAVPSAGTGVGKRRAISIPLAANCPRRRLSALIYPAARSTQRDKNDSALGPAEYRAAVPMSTDVDSARWTATQSVTEFTRGSPTRYAKNPEPVRRATEPARRRLYQLTLYLAGTCAGRCAT